MFNWYIPQELKTIGKWGKRVGIALVVLGILGFAHLCYTVITNAN